ncbi:MAG: glycerol kinase [Omnitrophica bacterium RIFCSPLOWO2_01_FULL_45_10b]|nr:MAG: glycerol kinase [Omnitrophica bacterium RIFCSPLOWO2_01_FULL_45_10b]
MPKSYILAIDQGTTGSRAILYDAQGKAVSSAYQEFTQHYPFPGWVEHNAQQILKSVKNVIGRALTQARISSRQIQAIGITNQRETTVLWDRKSGLPCGRAIVWQDRRTASICQKFRDRGLEKQVRQKTGLFLDPYFSGTKLTWIFDHHPSLRRKARSGSLCFGTIDSWLLFHLTGKIVHATDFTNASRTLLFDIKRKKWDSDLCRIFRVPQVILPQVKSSGSFFGKTRNFTPLCDGIPICALMGDQQAALFGQGCYDPGDSKNTYGTGCFLLLNLGKRFIQSRNGLVTTLACDKKGKPVYALEGSIFIAGAAVQWLRDGLKLIRQAKETEAIAKRTSDAGDLVVVPAFTGLGAPYWRADVRGVIFGITRGTSREMIIKATLDSIAYQVKDVFDLMRKESGAHINALRVDGGASQNSYLMQLQSNLLKVPVLRTDLSESTAWGAAKLAGFVVGFWPNLAALDRKRRYDKFRPKMSNSKRVSMVKRWESAVRHLISS